MRPDACVTKAKWCAMRGEYAEATIAWLDAVDRIGESKALTILSQRDPFARIPDEGMAFLSALIGCDFNVLQQTYVYSLLRVPMTGRAKNGPTLQPA